MIFREYLGVLDDVIVRYRPDPYRSEGFVRAVLAEELLYGMPGLLNDGYLVQHPVLSDLLLRKDDGFRELLSSDCITLASAVRPPSISIGRRASAGVSSHRRLVESRDWPELATAIDDLPTSSAAFGTSWPTRNMTDGFAALASQLQELTQRGGIPKSAGLPAASSISEFLGEFLLALGRHHEAPRTQWEELAIKTWSVHEADFLAMMDIANLIYHLNISMLLGADNNSASTLVTRDSTLLAPLLGVVRIDDVLPLSEIEYVQEPNLSPDRISAVLEDSTLANYRQEAIGQNRDTATLAAHIDAVGRAEFARDLRVRPISTGWIEDHEEGSRLRIVHFTETQEVEHLRLTIPPEFCARHAATSGCYQDK